MEGPALQEMLPQVTNDLTLHVREAHSLQGSGNFADSDDSASGPNNNIEDNFNDEATVDENQTPSTDRDLANLSYTAPGKFQKKFLATIFILFLASIFATIAAKNSSSKEVVVMSGRAEEIVRFLFEMDASTLPTLRDPAFPQHKAAMFVADGDAYDIDPAATPESPRRFLERYVLAVIYYHFNGPEWNYNLNFLTPRDHCEWYQVFDTPSGHSVRMGVSCNEEGHVTKLNLSQNNLEGHQFPYEIRILKSLETCHMHFNTIRGEFPEAFRKMKGLKSIGLMQNLMGGTIPTWIGEMTQLTTLGLGNNFFNGDVPPSMYQLRQLRILGLDDNQGLTGNLNLFKDMYSLEALYLDNNAFTGQLPDSPSAWPKLVELDISNNMIDESIPAALINHESLVVLDLHKNMLTGTFPDDIFENTNLQVLALHENLIGGTIPDRLAFVKNLKHVDLSFNKLTGVIPDDVSQLTDLRYWATSNNRFSEQTIPDLSRMTNLMDLSMKHNNLVGNIPDWVGGLSNLEMLDLDSNQLTGSIPSWLGLLTGLNHLLLNRNKLVGTIPNQFQNLRNLDVLLLDGNSITGNADAVCESDSIKPTYFVSDCYPGMNGERPEIECRCCTTCCADEDTECNNHSWTANVDPIWEYGFLRPNYKFSLANAPAAYSKETDSAVIDPIDGAFETGSLSN